jgi:transcriptional regulator with XRE-family HTH domain
MSEKALSELTMLSAEINSAKVARSIRIAMFQNNEMSHKDFASEYGCSVAHISNLRQNGTTSINVIKKTAEVLKMSFFELIKLGDNQNV